MNKVRGFRNPTASVLKSDRKHLYSLYKKLKLTRRDNRGLIKDVTFLTKAMTDLFHAFADLHEGVRVLKELETKKKKVVDEIFSKE